MKESKRVTPPWQERVKGHLAERFRVWALAGFLLLFWRSGPSVQPAEAKLINGTPS
jgi:hypothetical protein